MKVDAQHFDIIIGARLKSRYTANGAEPAVQQKAQKGAGDKRHYGIIGKTAAANTNGHKHTCQENKANVGANGASCIDTACRRQLLNTYCIYNGGNQGYQYNAQGTEVFTGNQLPAAEGFGL